MSDDRLRDITLERVNRLSQAVADLMEGQAAQNRSTARLFDGISQQLDRIEGSVAALAKDVRGVASKQLFLANRVEDALARAFRASLRLDEIESGTPTPSGS